MANWETCPAVERHPLRVSGAWVMPLRTVVSCFLLAMTSGCMQKQDEVRDATMIDLEMDLRIGTVDGPVETQFGQVAALAVDDVGSVYVGDGDNHEVRKFDRNGTFLVTFGQRGEGPGEFSNVDGVAVLADGRLAVTDATRARVVLFNSATGEYGGEWELPRQWLVWARHGIVSRSQGGVYLGLPPRMGIAWPRPVFASMDDQGSLVDTIWAPERYVEQCGTPSSHSVRSGYREDLRALYAPKVVWTISSLGELMIGCPTDFRFDIISRDGVVASSETVGFEPVPISAQEMSWFKTQIAAGQDMTIEDPNVLLNYDYPTSKAAFKALTVAADGTVWARLSQPGRESTTPTGMKYWHNELGGTFEVFSGTGAHIGTAKLPPDVWIDPDLPPAVPAVITGEHLWAVTLDSLNVEYVTRYRIGWPVGGR